MKKLFLSLGSIASVVAPVTATISSGHETRASDPLTTESFYQWGFADKTIDNPKVETLQHYIERKGNTLKTPDKAGAIQFLIGYANQNPGFGWYIGTQQGFEEYKKAKPIIDKADKGQLIDDIAIWHNVFSETLIKIIIFKYSNEPAMRVRMKVISDVIAKYNLDLVIKDFKPDYEIPTEDKTKLIDGLKEVDAYDDGIYKRLAQGMGLEASALHNEVIDAYEKNMQTLHQPQQFHGNTLAGEMANAGA